jgi:hypothetical protein
MISAALPRSVRPQLTQLVDAAPLPVYGPSAPAALARSATVTAAQRQLHTTAMA